MILQERISLKIKKLCKKRGMTYYELAKVSTVPLSTIRNILNGKTKNARFYTLAKIFGALDTSVVEFFDTEEFRGMEFEDFE